MRKILDALADFTTDVQHNPVVSAAADVVPQSELPDPAEPVYPECSAVTPCKLFHIRALSNTKWENLLTRVSYFVFARIDKSRVSVN